MTNQEKRLIDVEEILSILHRAKSMSSSESPEYKEALIVIGEYQELKNSIIHKMAEDIIRTH